MAKSPWGSRIAAERRPFDRPAVWVEWVNTAQTEAEIETLRKCKNREKPYGTETWKTQIAVTLGLKTTLQPHGRPKNGLTNTQTVRVTMSPSSSI